MHFLDNLHKIKSDWNKYKNGDIVPEWNNYKFHCARIVISKKPSNVTDAQISLTCYRTFTYNDNKIPIGFSVYETGGINVGGTQEIIENSYITEIYMWN